MIGKQVDSETRIIFLAMIWGGGGSYSLSQIIHAYDWINRAIPEREEIETALNILLSYDFIAAEAGSFSVNEKVGMEFETYRKRIRKRKFKAMQMYFSKLTQDIEITDSIKITEKEYSSALREYKKFMES